MSELSRLRSRLGGLRRRRWQARLAAGYSALVIGTLGTIALAMLLDWMLVMSLAQRAIALVLIVAAAAWVFYRYTWPWLGQRENELDVALLIEGAEHIDSDLVAALQFETPEGRRWGSAQLEEAVIQRVAELGRQIDVERDAPGPQLLRRMTLVAASVAIWVVVFGLFPDYVTIFFKRLLLRSDHYPSRTAIAEIAINGRSIDPRRPGQFPVRIAANDPVRWTVACSGRLPENGEARLSLNPQSAKTIVELVPDESGVYRGQVPRLNESVNCQLYFGDAWTEPVRLIVVPHPVAELQMEVNPPSYVGQKAARLPAGLRQAAVVEGSQVLVHLKSQKRLQKATLTAAQKEYPLRAEDDAAPDGQRWLLGAADTPLAAVVEELQFSVEVTDEDGLHLEQPLQGLLRLQPDQRPRVAAEIVTPYVLPTARPTVYYRALDDFGLSQIAIVCQITHADGKTRQEEINVYRVAGEHDLSKDLEARHPLDLSPLKLVKGDEVQITVKAVDYRGPRPGQASFSEPRVFHVTDQEGILAMMMESDRKSAEQLQTMIQRQLGIGGSP